MLDIDLELDSRRFAEGYNTFDVVEELNGKDALGDLVHDSMYQGANFRVCNARNDG